MTTLIPAEFRVSLLPGALGTSQGRQDWDFQYTVAGDLMGLVRSHTQLQLQHLRKEGRESPKLDAPRTWDTWGHTPALPQASCAPWASHPGLYLSQGLNTPGLQGAQTVVMGTQ